MINQDFSRSRGQAAGRRVGVWFGKKSNEVKLHFDHWRATRTKRGKIPGGMVVYRTVDMGH